MEIHPYCRQYLVKFIPFTHFTVSLHCLFVPMQPLLSKNKAFTMVIWSFVRQTRAWQCFSHPTEQLYQSHIKTYRKLRQSLTSNKDEGQKDKFCCEERQNMLHSVKKIFTKMTSKAALRNKSLWLKSLRLLDHWHLILKTEAVHCE